jgi:hypothetical protein
MRKTILKHWAFFPSLLFISIAPSIFVHACSGNNCTSGIVLEPDKKKWEHGHYVFTFLLDNVKITCSGELPFSKCHDKNIICDGEGINVVEEGCLWKPSAHQYGDIHINATPKTVDVTIEHDGETIIQEHIVPEYETCGPSCKTATEDLEMLEGKTSGLIDFFK